MPAFTRSMSPEQRRNWWARQLSRQQSTTVPVAFCRQLGVPASTFYEWRRRVAQALPPFSQPAPLEPSPFRCQAIPRLLTRSFRPRAEKYSRIAATVLKRAKHPVAALLRSTHFVLLSRAVYRFNCVTCR
jgi:transposase-like protein